MKKKLVKKDRTKVMAAPEDIAAIQRHLDPRNPPLSDEELRSIGERTQHQMKTGK